MLIFVDRPEVTALGYGFMGLSAFYGKPKPDEERLKFIDDLYARGQRNWDTADMYMDSEDLLGKWFKANPDKRKDIFLATKFANYVAPDGTRSVRNEPEYIHAAIDKSLKRLGLPSVDLYYCHRMQSSIPVEVTMRELVKLQQAGKIKYIGLSECSADTLRRACKIAHVDAVQIEYSPFTMDIEDPQIGLLQACRELGVATVAYSPLGRGFLTGSIRSPDDFEDGDFRTYAPRFQKEHFHKNLELVDTLKALADKKGCTTGQLVLAVGADYHINFPPEYQDHFCTIYRKLSRANAFLQQFLMSQGPDIIPIPGTTKIKNYDENMGSLKVHISDDDNKTIRKAVDGASVSGARYPEAFAKSLFADTIPESEYKPEKK